MEEHYTAWLTTSAGLLDGDLCDITVLRDEIAGERGDDSGKTTIDWTSTGDPLFHSQLNVRHQDLGVDTTDQALLDQAESALRAAGWERAGAWENVDSGSTATVTRIS